ncbi:SOS response-associated peptidase, partial [Ochrobactrum sp. SFR4]|nr:SOS response-associated peptidase [Ochrobactrum sp. SFR4]
WLDCKRNRAKDVQHLLKPVQDDFFEAIPVSDKINHARYFGTDVHERVEEPVISQAGKLQKPVKPKKSAAKKKTDDKDDQFSMF